MTREKSSFMAGTGVPLVLASFVAGCGIGDGKTKPYDDSSEWKAFVNQELANQGATQPDWITQQARDEGLFKPLDLNPEQMRSINRLVADLQSGKRKPSYESMQDWGKADVPSSFRYNVGKLRPFAPEQIAAADRKWSHNFRQDEGGARMVWEKVPETS